MNGHSKVVLYGAKWCAFCRMLQTYMDSENIEYDYKDVDVQANEDEMLVKTEGKYLIPTVTIDDQVFQNPRLNELKEYLNG